MFLVEVGQCSDTHIYVANLFLQIDQTSTGIDREYLIKGFDDEFVAAYYSYAVDMAVIYGAERFHAELDMKDVINFEMALANVCGVIIFLKIT